MTIAIRRESGIATAALSPPEARTARPALIWAAIGVGALAIEVAAMVGWIASGEANPTPTGPTPVPTWMKWTTHGWEIGGLIAVPVFVYFFLIRPWRREGRVTTDGLLCLVLPTLVWQDTLLNYFQTWFVYNSEFWNFGAWDPHILGWLSPNANLQPEAVVWAVPFYLYALVGATVAGCWFLRRVKARWPNISNFRLVMVCLATFIMADCLIEPIWIRLGFWSYPGGISWQTLFHGNWYQFPIFEGVIAGALLTALVCARYFENDKGETLAERGLSRLGLTRGKKAAVRYLALVGIVNVAFLVAYNIPAAIYGLYSSPWPDDVQKRSYFTNGICGPGTTYACPGPAIPIPRPDSVHVSPDGTLHVPTDTSLGRIR